MNVFDKRPLSLILCILLGGFVFFTRGSDFIRALIVCAILLFIALPFFASELTRSSKILMRLSAIALILGATFSVFYFDCYFYAFERFDDRVEIYANVDSVSKFYSSKNITLSEAKVNGESFCDYSFIATLDGDITVSECDIVKFTGIIKDFESTSDFDSKTYYYSKGYSGEITEIEDFEIIGKANPKIMSYIQDYRNMLCSRIVENSDEESGGLLCALLLGERTLLSEEITLDFRRTGLSHLLALSGLHLTILAFALDFILSRFKINKKPRRITEMIFVILYVAFTGFPISVVRAALMLIISYILFLIARTSDSITTLFISVVIICTISPYSVYDISLWLSALATFGVILVAELKVNNYELRKPESFLKARVGKTLLAIGISLFAIGATLPLISSSFSKIAILGAVTTPIFSLLIQIYMYFGIAFLLLCEIIPMGAILNFLAYPILKSIGAISSISYIYSSAEYIIIDILITIFLIVSIAFIVLKIKRRKAVLSIIAVLLTVILSTSTLLGVVAKSGSDFDYYLSESNERFMIKSNRVFTVIDVTTPRASTARESVQIINDEKIGEVDSYIFTGYSGEIIRSVSNLISNVLIRNIYLPIPLSDEESKLSSALTEQFKNTKTQFHFYTTEDIISIEDFTFFPVYRADKSIGKCAFTILYNDCFYSYLSSGMLEADTKNVAMSIMNGSSVLILGRHGNQYYNYQFIYKIPGIQKIINSSKNLSIPQETRDFYKETDFFEFPEKVELIR